MSLVVRAGGVVLGCEDGRVVASGVGAPDEALDGARVTPGRVCAHTHLYSGLAPLGMPPASPPPTSFLQILDRVWWRLDRALDADALRAAARLYVAESLLAGTTTLVDHHESPAFIEGSLDVLADACEALGIRALLCYGATERNGGRDEARRGLAECARRAPTRRVRALVGLHASFTVSDDTIREAGALCETLGTVLHVHVAEDGADVDDARARGWTGPLERLDALGALPPGSVLAHGVHLAASQVRLAEARGWWLVHNPRSNLGNGVGYAASLAASERVALGTDGYPADMFAEVAVGRAEALAHVDDPARIDARLAAGGALVAERFEAVPEPRTPGALADWVVEDEAGTIRHVVVDGAVVVRDGALVHGDLDAIRAEAREQAARLWRRMEAI